MIWKFDLCNVISDIGGECARSGKHGEIYWKCNRQITKASENIRRAVVGTQRRISQTTSSTGAPSQLLPPKEHVEETKKVEQVIKGAKIAQTNSVESCEVHITETIEVDHSVLKIPLFAEKEKCIVIMQQRVSPHVQKPFIMMQRGATYKRTTATHQKGDLVSTTILRSHFVSTAKQIKYVEEDYPQCSFTSHKEQQVSSKRATRPEDVSPCGRDATWPFGATVPGALRPTRTRPLLGLTWCLLLLLSCTGSLVSVRELQETLNWSSKGQEHLKGPLSSKGPPMGVQAAIIPPAWANITVNPCALESWQLLYWPQHDKCYKIFSQGPCAVGEEVYHDPHSGESKCRCEKGRIRHTGRCHVAYTRGPCKPREYLVGVPQGEEAQCRSFVNCATGHVFWPPDGLCYRQFTQGPCQHGDLLHLHPDSGWPTCGCDSSLMRMQYWQHANTCHELLTRGPCVTGHVFTYNRATRTTECGCSPHLSSNYHRKTAQCFPLDTQGPCPDGHIFSLPTGATEPMCTCLSGHLLHVASGTCQRAYTRAVCTSGQFLKPDASAGVGVGRCAPVPCSNTGQLYHPETDSCYPVGSSGPCARGKLWVYERASSFRGRCHCDHKLVGYWGPHDICYPLGEKGPCPARHVVTYSPTKGLACSCDRRRGYTRWKGRCERITAADIIRDLISRNLMAPVQDRENHLSNSVMHSKARSLREETAARLTTRARFIRTTPHAPAVTPTTPQPTQGSIIEEDTAAADGHSGTGHRVDTHEIITFSRGSVNSIEEAASTQQSQRLEEEADISTRIARLTHRGLITRRTRRLPSSSQ
ncbi:protein of unknown function DUF4789 [Trinorchestia longiramus]|nr:protein of unknown function DUF4789 [Trinorchestia longiramus]